ncbi:MAG: hypothetical protein A2231_02750 [Candidatus Firestonebacteria bacterium RIFOXYA2_FULL_40_8]|nr:MAG: hypothetical protein A2231_02750 [Candidatus Firestonebacteria bacterium RIFOXYA2_FULL_40_8]
MKKMIALVFAMVIAGFGQEAAKAVAAPAATDKAEQVVIKVRLLDLQLSGDFVPDKKPLLVRFPALEREIKQVEGISKIDFLSEVALTGESGKEIKGQINIPAYFIKNEGERQKQDADLMITALPEKKANGKIAMKLSVDIGLNQKSVVHMEANTDVAFGSTIEFGYFLKPKSGNDKTATLFLVTAYPKCDEPPRCKDYPWISKLKAGIADKKDKSIADYRDASANELIVLDWRDDIPTCGNNGIFSYNIYRDNKPISGTKARKPFATEIPGDAVTFIDDTQKDKGAAYYYVVTAVSPDGQEQSISPNGSFSAAVIMPSK